MRRWLLLSACLGVLAPVAAAPLLPNGGFEAGDALAGWTLLNPELFSIDAGNRAEGARSLRYRNFDTGKRGPWLAITDVTIPPGPGVRVRGQARVSGFRGSVEVSFAIPGGLGGAMRPAGHAVAVSTTQGAASQEWQSFEFVTLPAWRGGTGRLSIIVQGTGQAWVDGLEVTPLRATAPEPTHPTRPPGGIAIPPPPAGAENLLRNPGFEGTGIEGPWRRFGNSSHAAGLKGTFDPSERLNGRSSARVSNRTVGASEPGGWMQTVSEVVPGSELLLLGHIRTADVRGSAFLKLECWGRRPAAESAAEELLAAGTSEAWWLSGDREWTQVAVRLRVPEGTTRAVVRCALAGQGSAWFDDVRLLGRAR